LSVDAIYGQALSEHRRSDHWSGVRESHHRRWWPKRESAGVGYGWPRGIIARSLLPKISKIVLVCAVAFDLVLDVIAEL